MCLHVFQWAICLRTHSTQKTKLTYAFTTALYFISFREYNLCGQLDFIWKSLLFNIYPESILAYVAKYKSKLNLSIWLIYPNAIYLISFLPCFWFNLQVFPINNWRYFRARSSVSQNNKILVLCLASALPALCSREAGRLLSSIQLFFFQNYVWYAYLIFSQFISRTTFLFLYFWK